MRSSFFTHKKTGFSDSNVNSGQSTSDSPVVGVGADLILLLTLDSASSDELAIVSEVIMVLQIIFIHQDI